MYRVTCDQCGFGLEVGTHKQAQFVAQSHAQASDHSVSITEFEA